MQNFIKLFLTLFISFFITLGINELTPNFKLTTINSATNNFAQLISKKQNHNHTIKLVNNNDCFFIFSQNKRQIQINSSVFVKFNFKERFLNKFLYKNPQSISFHNISYCLKNEICIRAP